MAKISYKVVCESVNANKQASQARFIIEAPAEAPVKGANVADRMTPRGAKTMIVAAFTDSAEAAKYTPGKPYTITIE